MLAFPSLPSPVSIYDPRQCFRDAAKGQPCSNGDGVYTLGDVYDSADLVQATAANRGIFLANTFNGLPGIRFTAANSQYMQKVFTLNQPCTLWMIGKLRTNGDVRLMSILLSSNGTTWRMSGIDSGIASNTNQHCWVVVLNGVNSFLVVDGVQGAVGISFINPGGFFLDAAIASSDLDAYYAGTNAAAFTLAQAVTLSTWATAYLANQAQPAPAVSMSGGQGSAGGHLIAPEFLGPQFVNYGSEPVGPGLLEQLAEQRGRAAEEGELMELLTLLDTNDLL